MARMSRRRAQQQQRAQQEPDDQDFEADVTADLSDFGQDSGGADFADDDGDLDFEADAGASDEGDFDFEADAGASDDGDFDFEADVSGGDEVDFAEDYEDEYVDEEPAPARRSARGSRGAASSSRAAGRSSRRDRQAGASQRKKAAKKQRRSAKRELTEEEIEARRQARKFGIMMVLLMICIIGAAFAFYWFVMRTDPRRGEALNHLAQAEGMVQSIDRAIRQGDAKLATQQLEQALTDHIILPQFGSAQTDTPNPDNPEIVDVQLAVRAFELRQELEGFQEEIDRIYEDREAKLNFDHIMGRLIALGPDTEPDLDALRSAAEAFIDNPYDPESGLDLAMSERYRMQYVIPIRNKMVDIESERARRIAAGTTDVVARVNLLADSLVKSRRYGEALRLLDENARDNPDAQLGPVRKHIEDSAARDWKTTKNAAANEFKVANNAGSAGTARKDAIDTAIKMIRDVINTFGSDVPGISQYVDEARDILAKYEELERKL